MNPRFLLWLILVIVLITIFIDLPKLPKNVSVKVFGAQININNLLDRFPLKLGLDLQGGSQLTLQTDMSQIAEFDRDSALESAKGVIERRVNLFGVSESMVQTSKLGNERRIIVELPGLKDATQAAQLVGKTARLEFKEQATPSAIATDLTGADLKKSQVTFGGGQQVQSGPVVQIEFNDAGAKKFADITRRNVGKPLAIFLDDQLISAPIVQQEIAGGTAIVSGNFSLETAKELVIQLNAGALPVPIKILEQRSVGPSLGQQSINKSIVAGVVGISIVIIYMALFYGIWGILADLALVVYALLVLVIFKTGLFILPPITLTLAGIAGFILSIGMAVDANILIFERMKEELRWGKGKIRALQLGFERAWSSIWASNISSLMTAGILYFFGTSFVRGFAVTLAIGVLVSMFTAIVVTRTFLRILIK